MEKRNEKNHRDIDAVASIEDVNSGRYFFRRLFSPHHTEILWRRDFAVRRAREELFARFASRDYNGSSPRQPPGQLPARYSTKCGLMPTVGGRLLFIAFPAGNSCEKRA